VQRDHHAVLARETVERATERVPALGDFSLALGIEARWSAPAGVDAEALECVVVRIEFGPTPKRLRRATSRDREEPAADAAFVPEARGAAVGGQERFLQYVLCGCIVAKEAAQEAEQAGLVGIDEGVERGAISGGRGGQQLPVPLIAI
jgi:hypothetical protein